MDAASASASSGAAASARACCWAHYSGITMPTLPSLLSWASVTVKYAISSNLSWGRKARNAACWLWPPRTGLRRVLSRPGYQCASGGGLRHALSHGATRDRTGGGRTAQPERLHPVGFSDAAQDLRAGGQLPTRLDHRVL